MHPTLHSGRTTRPGASGPAVFPYGRVDGPSRWPTRTDATRCPQCDGRTVNAQGIGHCPDCAWTADG